MQRELGKDIDPMQRITFLNDNCDGVEERGYMKRLKPEEIREMKDELAETGIEINDIEEEKKEANKIFKARIDPLKVVRKSLLANIKQKAVYTKENCYKFIDQEERMTTYYNGEGDMIDSRPATADELQSTIFQGLRKTGTND